MGTSKTTKGTRTNLSTFMADLRSEVRFNLDDFNSQPIGFVSDEASLDISCYEQFTICGENACSIVDVPCDYDYNKQNYQVVWTSEGFRWEKV